VYNSCFLKVIEVNGQKYSGPPIDLILEIQNNFQLATT